MTKSKNSDEKKQVSTATKKSNDNKQAAINNKMQREEQQKSRTAKRYVCRIKLYKYLFIHVVNSTGGKRRTRYSEIINESAVVVRWAQTYFLYRKRTVSTIRKKIGTYCPPLQPPPLPLFPITKFARPFMLHEHITSYYDSRTPIQY